MKDNDGYGGGTIISRKFVQRNWGESRKPSAKVFDTPELGSEQIVCL
jgi:hypothetical protein